MESISLKVGDIVCDCKTKQRFRILHIQKGVIVLCRMDIEKLDIFSMDIMAVAQDIANRLLLIAADSETQVVDSEHLKETERVAFEQQKTAMRKLYDRYGPTFLELTGHAHKIDVEHIAGDCGVSRKTMWKYIRRYLQSGMDYNSLLDRRRKNGGHLVDYSCKTGRPAQNCETTGVVLTDEVRAQFQRALEFYKSGRAKTLASAYNTLCSQFYMKSEYNDGNFVQVLLPESQRPTQKQFYYYCSTRILDSEKDAIKTSQREQRNDKRLLLSDNLHDILGPGDCFEMDEVEVDVSLVSTIDPSKTVGRPVVYAMVDVYTRLIVAVSVSFDNNSVLAMTHCFLNLSDDKVAYCQRYGLTIPQNVWPSNFLPKRIRCDRGAEYTSKKAERILNELGISRELAPPAMGSLKGSVEQLFHQMHAAQNPQLENVGLIEKRYDSNHHQEAALNIDEFTKVLLHFVVTYNQSFMENYPLTREMMAEGIQPIPIKLWKYGVKKYGSPKPIRNLEQYYYSLMTPVKATISRRGIMLDGLYYINYKDYNLRRKMYEAENKRVPIEMRMDERDVGALYYIDEGHLQKASLNGARTGNSDFAGVTRTDYQIMRKKLRASIHEGKEINAQLRVARATMNDMVIKNARAKVSGYADPSHMIEARHQEKQVIANQNNIGSRIAAEIAPDAPAKHTFESENSSTVPNIDTGDKDFWEKAMELMD